jgi:hypothetical protein
VAMDADAQTGWVNAAVQGIAAERDWPWLDATDTFTTVAGQIGYTLPTDWARTRSVVVEGQNATFVSIRTGDDFDSWRDNLTYGFAIEGGELCLYPEPQSELDVTHRYVASEPALSNTNHVPLLPARFHWAVVHFAAALVFDRMGEMGKAAAQRDQWQAWKRRMLDDLGRAQGPKRIRVRAGGLDL